MKVEVITMMFNEEYLAPFFMGHYSWADKIKVFIDSDTTDNTELIVRNYPNSEVYKFKFPDMMDDLLKVGLLNDAYKASDADWVILVDADEFVFDTPAVRNIADILAWERTKGNDIIISKLYQVYRHITDKDLDVFMPAAPQRLHGDANTGANVCYNKPIVVRGGLPIGWTPGNHFIVDQGIRYNLPSTVTPSGIKFADRTLGGSHWAMADPCFCIERRCKGRRDRQSKFNLENKMTIQHHGITEKQIAEVCREHLYDPQILFNDVTVSYLNVPPVEAGLLKKFKQLVATPSDINEHLNTLKEYGGMSEVIVELGVREGVSTVALLVSRPKQMYSYDIEITAEAIRIQDMARGEGIEFSLKRADSREIFFSACDLLFIDTVHTDVQLAIELARHADSVRKWIILHDTVTYSLVGERPNSRGLLFALVPFLLKHPEWVVDRHYLNCNGLTILRRT